MTQLDIVNEINKMVNNDEYMPEVDLKTAFKMYYFARTENLDILRRYAVSELLVDVLIGENNRLKESIEDTEYKINQFVQSISKKDTK